MFIKTILFLKQTLKHFSSNKDILLIITDFFAQVLEAWSSGLNDTKFENLSTLLKNNCKREILNDIGDSMVLSNYSENATNKNPV
jgi:hypothetical protein